MNIWHLRELIKDLPDNSPVVMWIEHTLAQVSIGTRINNDSEGRPYLLLTAYEKGIIRDGKLKETSPPVRPAQIESKVVTEDRESTALVVIDSKGGAGAIIKR